MASTRPIPPATKTAGCERSRRKRDETGEHPDPRGPIRSAPALDREPLEGQGDEQVRGVRLDVGSMPDRVDGHRKDRDRQQQCPTPKQSTCRDSEDHHARQGAGEGKESQGPFREPEQPNRTQLRPEKQERANLAIIERREKVAIASTKQVDPNERLIPPEGEVEPIADKPEDQPQTDEFPGHPLQPREIWRCGLAQVDRLPGFDHPFTSLGRFQEGVSLP